MSAPPDAERAHAVIWDFDGTLVDSRRKNLSVSRSIIQRITGQPASTFAALSSVAGYDAALMRATNWREFYQREFGLSEADIDRAGLLWTEHQLRDGTEMPLFPGIAEALEGMRALPHGIVSQNGRAVILDVLRMNHLASYFDVVIGFEEVDLRRQKPAPEGLLRCLEDLTSSKPGWLFYVGDHETDFICAANARALLAERGASVRVISVGAQYGHEAPPAWEEKPDHVARRPADIVDIVESYIIEGEPDRPGP